MRIGELARELGVSADTLRFSEKSGLLPGPGRGENGYREYGAADVERLRLVVELRRLDIPVPDRSLRGDLHRAPDGPCRSARVDRGANCQPPCARRSPRGTRAPPHAGR